MNNYRNKMLASIKDEINLEQYNDHKNFLVSKNLDIQSESNQLNNELTNYELTNNEPINYNFKYDSPKLTKNIINLKLSNTDEDKTLVSRNTLFSELINEEDIFYELRRKRVCQLKVYIDEYKKKYYNK